jgi:hypothetical protein
MPTSPNIRLTCSNDRHTSNGEVIHHNTVCPVRIPTQDQAFKVRLKLQRRRARVRYVKNA